MTGANRAGLTPKRATLQDIEHASDHLDEIAEQARGTDAEAAIHALVHAIAHLRDAVTVIAREMPDD